MKRANSKNSERIFDSFSYLNRAQLCNDDGRLDYTG